MENNIDDKIRRAVHNAVLTVEKCMHDPILTAMDKEVIPRVEMAVWSITGSSRHEPKSEVLYPDWRDFSRNAGNTPLMSASSPLDLNTNQKENDESRNEENFQDVDFQELQSNHDQREQAHHKKIDCMMNQKLLCSQAKTHFWKHSRLQLHLETKLWIFCLIFLEWANIIFCEHILPGFTSVWLNSKVNSENYWMTSVKIVMSV